MHNKLMLFVPATALPPPDLRFAAAADQGVKSAKQAWKWLLK
ncbi:Uncharacterised protein [BD1-7 clade bacterium]|uniref:Uncharacterized protein n=1 Tax=BD1-7 clade bacterium TaxID=2029982 RepID=A0A5S9Q674_9GAMM|nr:Uncharacterised protein [BD1-7 clade bacterium]